MCIVMVTNVLLLCGCQYEGIQRIKQLEEDNEELRQQLVDASRPQV